MESKAPSLCRLCNISLANPSVWREHAKSDLHVYNLRVKVAEPGTVITPPSASSPNSPSGTSRRQTQRADVVDEESDDGSDYESEGQDLEPPAGLQFDAQQCLFCNTESGSFDENLLHMSKSHSFTIPYQDHLTVDLEAIVGYLHLVIHGYRECILCAAHRRTVEGIQHHMTAKGHCRFDVASDIGEFYNLPSQSFTADDESLRLASGKLLSHPNKAAGPSASRAARASTRRRMALTTLPTSRSRKYETDVSELQRNDGDAAPSSDTQLSRLAKSDQQSLAHLQEYQVRSLVAAGAKAIDGARREAKHSELRLSTAGNTTLTGTFRADTSKKTRGVWG